MMEWQLIDTAPKDRPILLAIWDSGGPYYVREVGWWEEFSLDDDVGFWSAPCAAPELGMFPTHWMELPDPPENLHGELE